MIRPWQFGGSGPIFQLPLNDLGAGAVNTTTDIHGGSGTATFTRATTAYTTLSSGLLAQVNSGVARSTYSADGLTYLGYLAEGSRTNLALQSQTFDNASWTKNGTLTVTADAAVAPDGTTTADLAFPGSTGADRYTRQIITKAASSIQYTLSVYAKPNSWTWILLQASNNGSNGVGKWINVSTGALGTSRTFGAGFTLDSSSTEVLANGWIRLKITVTTETTTAVTFDVELTDADNSTTATASGSNGVYLWGAQLEAAAFASTYIPTTVASVTKNLDVDQYVSSGNLNSAAMTLALSWTPEAASMGTVFLFGTYVDASNYTAILHDGTNIVARKRIAGVNHDATKALTYVAGTTYRIAARFDNLNGVDVWVAGVKGTGDATTTASQIGTNFQVMADGNGANSGFGAAKNFVAYGVGLSNARAAAL